MANAERLRPNEKKNGWTRSTWNCIVPWRRIPFFKNNSFNSFSNNRIYAILYHSAFYWNCADQAIIWEGKIVSSFISKCRICSTLMMKVTFFDFPNRDTSRAHVNLSRMKEHIKDIWHVAIHARIFMIHVLWKAECHLFFSIVCSLELCLMFVDVSELSLDSTNLQMPLWLCSTLAHHFSEAFYEYRTVINTRKCLACAVAWWAKC